MTKTKTIHCALWDDIQIDERARIIIDDPWFQRLHYIHQLGFAYRVYPTAHTTRFEHSLGVYHVVKTLLQHIRTTQSDVYESTRHEMQCQYGFDAWEWIPYGGLLHDIGHGPFSHFFDSLLATWWESSPSSTTAPPFLLHESRSCWMVQMLGQKYGWTPLQIMFVTDLIQPHGLELHGRPHQWYHDLICHSVVDMDRLDYLLRDAHHLGLVCGVNARRIFTHIRVMNNRLIFSRRIKNEIEQVLLTRQRFFQYVYQHPAVLRFEQQFTDMCDVCISCILKGDTRTCIFGSVFQRLYDLTQSSHTDLSSVTLMDTFMNDFVTLTDHHLLLLCETYAKKEYQQWLQREWTCSKIQPPEKSMSISTLMNNVEWMEAIG